MLSLPGGMAVRRGLLALRILWALVAVQGVVPGPQFAFAGAGGDLFTVRGQVDLWGAFADR